MYPVFSLVETSGLSYNRNAYGMKRTIQKKLSVYVIQNHMQILQAYEEKLKKLETESK